ncbi:MAG: carbon-nitrogen hydrolase family protein [Phycisphaerales bacterium]
MKAAIAQFAPAFMSRAGVTAQIVEWIGKAAEAGAELVCFGEAIIPAYPLWLSRTDAARFDDRLQKRLFARYAREAVCVEDGDLDPIAHACAERKIAAVIGIVERPRGRGHSLFCSRVVIGGHGDEAGRVLSVHRKLMPTYEERLVWGCGDAKGLVTHRIGTLRVGALNCWENWMPLARAALYEAGEDLHVMLWPGSERLTRDITRFAAIEGRNYVISASALIRPGDLPKDVPELATLCARDECFFYDGGSCIAAPDGSWVVEPVVGRESLITAELDLDRVREERQNFDPAGHYARPELLTLCVQRDAPQGPYMSMKGS